ncbi:MAG: hypothetical protein ABJE47_06785 [bacterium]
MLRIRPWHFPAAVVFAAVASASLGAQAAPAAAPTLNFSGLLFGSYNFQQTTTPSPLARQIDNSFIIDRAYLNFRMAAGDHGSIRITTDVYQTTEGTPNAYTLRAKYAYFQYDGDKSSDGAQLVGRVGILHNVVIDHAETFWPRYLSQSAVERAGYFASADAGIAGLFTLPSKMGEVYTTITNGPGYTSRETDRFKDYAVRLTLTPLANNKDMPLLNTFTVSAWGYKGATASACVVAGACATSGQVGEALDRSRAGVLVGIKDPRLVLAAEYAQRHEDGELTPTTTRTKTEITGHLLSAFTVVRPFAFMDASGKSPFGIVARYDMVTPNATNVGFTTTTDNAYHTAIAGVFYDLNQKIQLALDYQESLAATASVSAPPAQSKAYFAHFQVAF